MLQATTTSLGKTIYVETDYIFQMQEAQQGALLYSELENFFLKNIQALQVQQTPEQLTTLRAACIKVTTTNGARIYLNRKYIFKLITQDTHTDIYISVKQGFMHDFRILAVNESAEAILAQYPTTTSNPTPRAYSSAYSNGYA